MARLQQRRIGFRPIGNQLDGQAKLAHGTFDLRTKVNSKKPLTKSIAEKKLTAFVATIHPAKKQAFQFLLQEIRAQPHSSNEDIEAHTNRKLKLAGHNYPVNTVHGLFTAAVKAGVIKKSP